MKFSRAEMSALIARTAGKKKTVVGTCPNCHGEVVEYTNNYSCENHPHNCDFILYKSCFSSLGKKSIASWEVSMLLRDKLIDLPGLVNKQGDTFSTGGRLQWTERYGWGIEFCARPTRAAVCAAFPYPKPPKTFCRRPVAPSAELTVDDSDTILENPGTEGEREKP